jgi:hypothetical protein
VCIDMASILRPSKAGGGMRSPQSLAALSSSLFFSAGDYPFSARTRISVITDFSILAAMFCRPMIHP